MKVMRFGDNMREVAVTGDDKVEVQTKLGWQVNTWAVGDLVKVMNEVTEAEIDELVETYKASYSIATDNMAAIRYGQVTENYLNSYVMHWFRRQSIPMWWQKLLVNLALSTNMNGQPA